MTITSLNGVNNSQQPASVQSASAKLQAALANLVTGSQNTQDGDVTLLATASQLQAQTAGLKQASTNLAQATSLAEVANGGVTVIQTALSTLQSLATQAASPILSDATRKQLNDEFQQIATTVDQAATGTSFDNQSLLDGSIAGGNALSLDTLLGQQNDSNGNTLSIGDLSTNGLFGGQQIDISTPDGAQSALSAIGQAIDTTVSTRASIGSFQQAVNFAAANVDSAVANQEAAQANLSDADFAQASTQASLDNIQQNAAIATAAQGNRLTPAVLQLIS